MRSLQKVFLAWLVAFSMCLLAVKTTCAEILPLKDGQIFHGGVSFEDHYWPLPEGEWELLAYIPKATPLGSARSFRLVFAKYGQSREVKGLIIYQVGEASFSADRTADGEVECEGQDRAPYLGDRQIRDKASDYSCWRFQALDSSTLPVDPNDPEFDVVRLKLRQVSKPKIFLAVESLIRQNGRLAEVAILLDPSVTVPENSPIRGAVTREDFWKSTAIDTNVGTRFAIWMLMREWAIRWQERVQHAFNGGFQNGTDLPISFPLLQNPNPKIAAIPDLGLRPGETYSAFAPIGPFLIPLPPGIWKVLMRHPQIGNENDLQIDQVTLVNIENGVLQGVVSLEQRFIRRGGEDPACKAQPAQNFATNPGPDDYCAILNWLDVHPNDDHWPMVQELAAQHVEAPKSLIGSLFIFSNKLIKLHVYVAFSPTHVGLPDVATRNTGTIPSEWTPFAPKWMQWTKNWADLLQAGMNGTLSIGPLPAKWRDLDLKSERMIPIAVPKLGETYKNTVSFGGRDWPLPDGDWTVLAVTPQMQNEQVISDQIILGRQKERSIDALVALSFSRPDLILNINETMGRCGDHPGYFSEHVEFELGLMQDCWTIYLPGNDELRKMLPGFDVAEAEARNRGLSLPRVSFLSAFSIANRDRGLAASYSFSTETVATNPKMAEINDVVFWRSNDRANDPLRKAVSQAVHDWTRTWHDAVRAGFDGKLKPGMPSQWAPQSPHAVGQQAAVMQPKPGESYTETLAFGEHNWPLPQGTWTVLATNTKALKGQTIGDQIILGRVNVRTIDGIISIILTRPGVSLNIVSPAGRCANKQNDFNKRVTFEPGILQDCWTVYFLGSNELKKTIDGFEAAEAEASNRDLKIAGVILASGFSIMNKDRLLNAFYGFSSSAIATMLKPSEVNDLSFWRDKDPKNNLKKVVPFLSMREWTRKWHDAVKSGFDDQLKLGVLPAPWARLDPKKIRIAR